MNKKIYWKDLTEEQKHDLETQGFWTGAKSHPSGNGVIVDTITLDIVYDDEDGE